MRISGSDRPAYTRSSDFRDHLVDLARKLDNGPAWGPDVEMLSEALDNAAFVIEQLEQYT